MTRIPAIALALLLLTAAPLAAQPPPTIYNLVGGDGGLILAAPTPRPRARPKAQDVAHGLTYVTAAKAALVQRGQTFTSNCDAFQITARVAWALRADGARLFLKSPAQNGCVWNGVKYSHDAIAFPTGWVDVLASAGPPANENRPVWQWTASGPSNPAQLAAPIDLDAGSAPVVTPPPVDPPIVPPPAVLLELLGRVLLDLQQLRAEQAGTTDALAKVRSDLTDLRVQLAHGYSGSLFGYPVTLKPVP